ncbi:MAG: OsmC family protein [Chloroflexi bacterium]|nr:OsmC family protein [Chloroflexota bacterium]
MANRTATAVWQGDLKTGKGTMHFADYDGRFSFSSRFEEGAGTNPEELLGAAHAGCYSMAFGNELSKAGYNPENIATTAHIALRQVEGHAKIVSSHLVVKANVPGISEDEFQKIALAAKEGCPVSQALAGLEISLDAELA